MTCNLTHRSSFSLSVIGARTLRLRKASKWASNIRAARPLHSDQYLNTVRTDVSVHVVLAPRICPVRLWGHSRGGVPRIVRCTPRISQRFISVHSPRLDSAKTYGN